MDPLAARAALGLDAGADPTATRAAFRRLLHDAHPDRNSSPDAADRTRELVEAFRSLGVSDPYPDTDLDCDPLRNGGSPGGSTADDEGSPEPGIVTLVAADTIGLDCPADEAFAVLLEVAHRIGDVTYLDRQNELLEALLRTTEGTTLSMVISLQGRASGITEAFVTLEPIDRVRGDLPDVGGVTALVAHHALHVLAGR